MDNNAILLLFNTLRPKQNGRHFADDILKCIFLKENILIPNNISLKFVPKGPINNNPALVQVMAWRRPGDKPSPEPMMFRLPTHICVTRPQWVDAYAFFRTPMSRWDRWRGARLQYLQCVSDGRYCSLALSHRDRPGNLRMQHFNN